MSATTTPKLTRVAIACGASTKADKSTGTNAQHKRIVEALREGPQTTDTLRALGIYQVSARIFGLRAQGFEIHTELFTAEAADSYVHSRMARYSLMREPKGGAA